MQCPWAQSPGRALLGPLLTVLKPRQGYALIWGKHAPPDPLRVLVDFTPLQRDG